MTQNRILRLLALAILCVLPACPAMVAYTGLIAWQAEATQSGVTVDFANLPYWPYTALIPGGATSALTHIVCADPGFTFTSPSDLVQVNYALASGVQPWYEWGTGAIIHPFNRTTGVLQVGLTTAATAFATYMMIPNGASGSSMTVTVKSGTTALSPSPWTLATSALSTPTFFGVVSTDPLATFNSIVLAPPTNQTAMLDNVRVGAYKSSTPDPDPIPELGAGFLAFGGVAAHCPGPASKALLIAQPPEPSRDRHREVANWHSGRPKGLPHRRKGLKWSEIESCDCWLSRYCVLCRHFRRS